ncbi:MAG: serine/threonine-protein kinase [Planctomycetota bacterium]
MSPTRLSLFDLKEGNVLLDAHRIVAPHRENGMSAAFEVEDVESGAQGELQAFPSSLFEGPGQAESFAQSLLGWRDLHSEAVAELRSVQVLDDGAVIAVTAMPEGRMLRDAFGDAGPMPVDAVVALGSSVLDGLESAHGAGLVHGDIKPTTVFVREDGTAQLVDAGVTPGLWAAKHLGTRTALIGTPYYAPLEQFGGDSPDERSDLYNLATVMFELLTGVMPWRGRSYIEVFQSKMQPEAPSMRSVAPDVEIDRDLEAAIARALRGKRMERHASAEDFRAALEAATGA